MAQFDLSQMKHFLESKGIPAPDIQTFMDEVNTFSAHTLESLRDLLQSPLSDPSKYIDPTKLQEVLEAFRTEVLSKIHLGDLGEGTPFDGIVDSIQKVIGDDE